MEISSEEKCKERKQRKSKEESKAKKNGKNEKIEVDIWKGLLYNMSCVTSEMQRYVVDGVWLSLARAPGLGPGGRRFESCHPDRVRV